MREYESILLNIISSKNGPLYIGILSISTLTICGTLLNSEYAISTLKGSLYPYKKSYNN